MVYATFFFFLLLSPILPFPFLLHRLFSSSSSQIPFPLFLFLSFLLFHCFVRSPRWWNEKHISSFQVFCLYLKINFIHTFGQSYLLFILNSVLNLILFSFLAVKADQTRCRSYYGILVERIMLGTKLILLLHLFFFFLVKRNT